MLNLFLFKRIKQYDPAKQVVFPLKYYEKANFKAFLQLFGEDDNEIKNIAIFGYFAGLRIFEIVKLKRKDIKQMNDDKGLSIMVFGKGSKHRTTYIMDKHVVTYITNWLKSKDLSDSEYVFMQSFWNRNY